MRDDAQPEKTYGMKPRRTVRDRLRALYYAGLKYRCPFCGYRCRRWSPIGWDISTLTPLDVAGAGRREAGCFKCGSNDRERLVFVFLESQGLIKQLSSLRVLHVAPEVTLREFFQGPARPKRYVMGDKTMPGYRYPPDVVDMDIQAIPFADDSFDLILCNHVLEHVQDDRSAMRELHRVLAPGGIAVLQVPYAWGLQRTAEDPTVANPAERERRFGQFDHVRLYGADYAQRLRDTGFHVEVLMFGEDPAYSTAGLSAAEPLFAASKPTAQP